MSPGSSIGRVVAGRYRIVAPIGSGGHGVVDLAEDLLNGGRRVALKRLEGIVGAGDPEPAADHLRWFRHPRWAEVLDEGRLDAHGRFQVLRYVEGASLDHVGLPLPTDEVLAFLEDGARVLGALHARGLIHYDVTPGNFLREERGGKVVFTLTDGGLANLGPVKGIARGTVRFMAPEVADGAPHDHRVDLYALGLVAFRLATGRDPWTGGAGDVLGGRRREAAPSIRAARTDADPRLESIVAALLERDPNRRVPDAAALLALLVEAGRSTAGAPLEGEFIASAESGFVFGREREIERFRIACRALLGVAPSAALPTAPVGAPTDGEPTAALADNVLLVCGAAGSGGTRLVREYGAIARAEGVALLTLSGREGAADRRGPLRRMADGIALLTGQDDPLATTGRADQREGRDDATAGDDVRGTERFIALCDRTAEKTPLVLVVEDFEEFPASAQEAIRVLARHLLSRSEHPDGRAPSKVLLVVDHGAEDPQAFLLPDAVDPRRPVQALKPLTVESIRAIAADRFAGLEPVAEDVETVRAVSEGLPGLVVAVLAQARERGDLRRDGAVWIWNASSTPSYALDRRVSASQARALASLSPAAREVAQYLALLEVPVPEEFLLQLCSREAIDEFTASCLASVSLEGASRRMAMAGRGLSLSRSQQSNERHACVELSHRLRRRTCLRWPELQIERARILASFANPNRALTALSVALDGLRPVHLTRALTVCVAIMPSANRALARSTTRARLLALLSRSTTSHTTALADGLLAAELASTQASTDASLKLADYFLSIRDTVRAVSLVRHLNSRLTSDQDSPQIRAELAIVELRSAAIQGASATNDVHRRSALAALRRLVGGSRRLRADLLAHLSMASARAAAYRGAHTRAIALSHRAARLARRAGRLDISAAALNNMSISSLAVGDHGGALRALRRSLRIREALCDVRGAVVASQNLGRLLAHSGSLIEAAAAFSRSFGVATRHAMTGVATAALMSLSELQDKLGSAHLARTTITRAARAALGTGSVPFFPILYTRLAELSWATDHAALPRELDDLGAASEQTAVLLRYRETISGIARGFKRRPWHRLHAGGGQDFFPDRDLRLALHLLHRLPRVSFARAIPGLPDNKSHLSFPTLARHALHVAASLSLSDGHHVCASLESMAATSAPLPGPSQRLLASLLLAACQRHIGLSDSIDELLLRLSRLATQRGWRTVAARAISMTALGASRRAEFVRAGRLLASVGGSVHLQRSGSAATRTASLREIKEIEHLYRRSAHPSPSTQSGRTLAALIAFAHCADSRTASGSPDSRREQALRAILEFAARTQASPKIEPLLDSLNDFAREITRAERTRIILVDEGNPTEIHVASSSGDSVDGGTQSPFSHTIVRRVLRERTPLLLHDVYGDSDLVQRPSIVAMSLRSILCVPLLRGGNTFGAMYADNSIGAASFDQTDLDVLTAFAVQASAAIENSRLLRDAQRSLADLRAAQERLLNGERLRVMGEMTSGVAHEFNNLLTAILARIQLMGLDSLPDGLRGHLVQVERAALDAANVVRRLQGFSRQQRQGTHQVLDIGVVCSDVVELLRPLWASRRRHGRPPISVRVDVKANLRVSGDRTELREVVTNLVKNALDALNHGGTITVSAAADGRVVRVAVIDDGPGIPSELRERVFTPFFTTKGDRGTGLGLCLCKQIIERHGGTLSLANGPEGGAVAEFSIPTALEPLASGDAGERALEAAGRRSVLVVDDDPNVLSPLCDYLSRSGYRVVGRDGGASALEELQVFDPDLILSDISMPGTDGFELCRRARRLRPNTPIVLMSGQASAVDGAAVAHAGAAGLIAKPFTMRQIVELIEGVPNRA